MAEEVKQSLSSAPKKHNVWRELRGTSAPMLTPAEKTRQRANEIEARNDQIIADFEKAQAQAEVDKRNSDFLQGKMEWLGRNSDQIMGAIKDLNETRERLAVAETRVLDLERKQASDMRLTQSLLGASASENYRGAGRIVVQDNVVAINEKLESFGKFKVTADKLWVYDGNIVNNYNVLSVDSKALTLSGDTEYIYVKQSKLGFTPTPTIEHKSSMPEHSDADFEWPLARFVKKETPSSGSDQYTWELEDVYHTGDIHQSIFMPDALQGSGDYESLEYRQGSDPAHFWDGQLFDFTNPSSVDIDNWGQLGSDTFQYLIVGRLKYSETQASIKYLDLRNFKAAESSTSDYADSAGIANYARTSGTISDTFITGDLLPELDTRFDARYDKRYWIQGGSSSTNYGISIGNYSTGNVVIDLTSSYLQDGAEVQSVAWASRELKDENAKKVLKWTSAGWQLGFGSGDSWSASGLKISSIIAAAPGAGALQVQGGGAFGVGLYSSKGGALAAGTFTDGSDSVSLCNGTYALQTNGDMGASSINVTDAYYIGGLVGATQTASKVRLPLASGGYWEGYIRGGILTDA